MALRPALIKAETAIKFVPKGHVRPIQIYNQKQKKKKGTHAQKIQNGEHPRVYKSRTL